MPENGILLAGGTIVDAQGGAAALGHDAVAADAAHRVDGSTAAPTGGVCERTPQVRDALVAAAQANDAAVTDCSQRGRGGRSSGSRPRWIWRAKASRR